MVGHCASPSLRVGFRGRHLHRPDVLRIGCTWNFLGSGGARHRPSRSPPHRVRGSAGLMTPHLARAAFACSLRAAELPIHNLGEDYGFGDPVYPEVRNFPPELAVADSGHLPQPLPLRGHHPPQDFDFRFFSGPRATRQTGSPPHSTPGDRSAVSLRTGNRGLRPDPRPQPPSCHHPRPLRCRAVARLFQRCPPDRPLSRRRAGGPVICRIIPTCPTPRRRCRRKEPYKTDNGGEHHRFPPLASGPQSYRLRCRFKVFSPHAARAGPPLDPDDASAGEGPAPLVEAKGGRTVVFPQPRTPGSQRERTTL